jgi:predicted outer membrane repeat protein
MPLGRRIWVLLGCLTVVLLAAAVVVEAGRAAGRPACLVSNVRTGLGARSLQEAIDAAVPGDTLMVKGTCVGNFAATKALTLDGVSNKPFGQPTLDGGGAGVVLAVSGPIAGFEVRVENLTIRNGLLGIDVDSASVALSRSTIRDQVGCGILGFFASADLTDSVVRDNGGCGMAGRMGLRLVRTSVTDNGGFGVGFARGGGFITDSVLTGNDGVGVTVGFDGEVTISRSLVSSNGGPGVNVDSASATISNSTVSENGTTQSGGGVSGFIAAVTVVDSTISENTAVLDGGGIGVRDGFVGVERSTISGNTAGRNGGGVFASGDLTLSDSAVIGNTATSGGGIFYDDSSFGSAVLLGVNTFSNNVPDDCVGISGC